MNLHLTPEQAAAIQQYAEAIGPGWQRQLAEAFQSGQYGPHVGALGEQLLNQVARKMKGARA